jgi:hypothetical protein
MGMHIIGSVNENNDIVFSGNLDAGIYTLKFEDVEGNVQEVGTIEIVKKDDDEPAYINWIPKSIDTDGTLYNGGQGWKTDYRLNSSGAEVQMNSFEITGFIPFYLGDIIYFSDVSLVLDADYHYIAVYDSNFNKLSSQRPSTAMYNSKLTTVTLDSNNSISSIALDTGYFMYWSDFTPVSGTQYYFRISSSIINNNSIITVN